MERHTWSTDNEVVEQAKWFADKVKDAMDSFCSTFGGKETPLSKCVGCMYNSGACPMAVLSTLPHEVRTRIMFSDVIIMEKIKLEEKE